MRPSSAVHRTACAVTVLLAAAALCDAPAVEAGAITLEIRTTVATDDGVSVALQLANKGDEAAHQVIPRISFASNRADGRALPVLRPGSKHDWTIKVTDTTLDPGSYALVVAVTYRDSNEYPLEVVAAAPFSVRTAYRPAVRGRFALPKLSTGRKGQGQLRLNVPPGRGADFEVEIVAPTGLTISDKRRTFQVDGERKVNVPIDIKNRTVLAGSRVNVFALVTGKNEAQPQTDIIRGVVATEVPTPATGDSQFQTILVTALFFFVVLQVVADSKQAAAPARLTAAAMDYAVAFLACAFILYYLPWRDLTLPTTTAGGDMASLFYPTLFMSEELLPNFRLTGWTMGNYAGFPIFHFYSTFPFFLIVIIGQIFPLTIVFKFVTLLGPVFLPLAAAFLFRALGYGPGGAIIAAASVLPMLFQQGNSMWGGNIPSVLAGEFCHAIGITLSLIFLGVLHRIPRQGGSWLLAGVLLALIGLTHTFTFIAAVWYSLFYLLPGRDAPDRIRAIIPVYGMAFLLLCFWGLPLPARVQFTTEWAMIWRIKDWQEVLPQPLWPAAALTVANLTVCAVTWLAATIATRVRGRLQATLSMISQLKPFHRDREGLLLFVVAGMGLVYLLAPAVGFPDIRFIPIAQIFLGLLAADFLYWISRRLRYPTVFGLCAMLAALTWTHANLGYVPSWLRWNYSGYESKATWPLFEKINSHLAGDINDPRVAFEHSQKHNQFGGSRAFENLPLFSGRSTLEGVFHQASLNSPFIFYVQSEISERGSGPFRQYTYTRLDPDKAVPHLRLYNVSDVVVVTDAAKAAYAASPNYERTLSAGAYEVFHLKGESSGYVSAATHEPVLYERDDWKLAFYRWFKHPALLDVPLVPAALIPRHQRYEFSLRTDTPRRIPRTPYSGECNVKSKLDHHRIVFDTDCPDRPHIVKVSYFPRWRAQDGSRVHPVSPGFMLVYPESPHVELVYVRNWVDWIGLCLTLGGLLAVVGCAVNRQLAERFRRLTCRPFEPVIASMSSRPMLKAVILATLAVSAGAATRYTLTAPERSFQAAKAAYSKRDFPAAIEAFRRWTAKDSGSFKQATALYQLGVSHSELDHHAAAVQILERLRFEFPDVNYGAGSLYHLARSYAGLGMKDRAREAAELLQREAKGANWLDRLRRNNPDLLQSPRAQEGPADDSTNPSS